MGMSNRLTVVLSKNCIEFRISVLHSSFSDGVQLGKIIGTAVSTAYGVNSVKYRLIVINK